MTAHAVTTAQHVAEAIEVVCILKADDAAGRVGESRLTVADGGEAARAIVTTQSWPTHGRAATGGAQLLPLPPPPRQQQRRQAVRRRASALPAASIALRDTAGIAALLR